MAEEIGTGKKRTVVFNGVEHYLACTKDEDGRIHFTLTGPEENVRLGMKRGVEHQVVDIVNNMLGEI